MAKKPLSLIPRRSTNCAKGGEILKPGEEIRSFLKIRNGILVREDYCLRCARSFSHQSFFPHRQAFWCGKVPHKKQKSDFLSDGEGLLEHLESLTLSDCEENQHLAFLLAVHLERKQILKRQQKSGSLLSYRVSSTGEKFEVKEVEASKLCVESLEEKFGESFS